MNEMCNKCVKIYKCMESAYIAEVEDKVKHFKNQFEKRGVIISISCSSFENEK